MCRSTPSGRFITIEGIEGVGKSTQIKYVYQCLEYAGIDVISTREPGGTELGEAIRGLLLNASTNSIHEDTELLLMFAARAEHLRRRIEPALNSGQWVLCDRFTDATYAYQGGGRGINLDQIATLEACIHPNLQPDLTLLLDCPVGVGLRRKHASPSLTDRFEMETEAFFERVREKYLDRAKATPQRFTIIDAQCPIFEVTQQIKTALYEKFPELVRK